MDQVSSYLCLVLVLALSLVLLVKHKKRSVRLPPGPWQLPIIGSLHHLASNPLIHRALADIARRLDAPLMSLKLGEIPVVVASSPEAAREFMKTHDVTFATRPWSPTVKIMMADGMGMVWAPYGDLWRQLRKICVLELLSTRRVQSFRHVREDEVGRFLASVAAVSPGEPVNLSARIAVLIADSSLRSIIGDRFEKREEFLENLTEGLKLVSGFNLGDLFPSLPFVGSITGSTRLALKNHRKSFQFIDHAIRQCEERRTLSEANGAVQEDEDLVDVLLRIHKEGGLQVPLTIGNIKELIVELFAAGSETSANTLLWAMSELMRNPRVMLKAQSELRSHLNGKANITEEDLVELKFLRLVIKETLRLHPATPLLLPRECTETCKVLGYDIPKGTMVWVNAWAISRDPKHWDNAEEFMPERFDTRTVDFTGTHFEYIPFGAGRRICPGIAFAQSNIELALAAMLYHFNWELQAGVKPKTLDMEEDMGMTVRRKKDLYLHAIINVPLHATS